MVYLNLGKLQNEMRERQNITHQTVHNQIFQLCLPCAETCVDRQGTTTAAAVIGKNMSVMSMKNIIQITECTECTELYLPNEYNISPVYSNSIFQAIPINRKAGISDMNAYECIKILY